MAEKAEKIDTHQIKEPIAQVRAIEDIILQIVPDPTCKRADCHGRGYVGIIAKADGSKVVLLCNCARYGETDYVRALKKVEQLAEMIRNMNISVTENAVDDLAIMQKIYRHTFFGGIKYSFTNILLRYKVWKSGGGWNKPSVALEKIKATKSNGQRKGESA